jgi:hypothetical protein
LREGLWVVAGVRRREVVGPAAIDVRVFVDGPRVGILALGTLRSIRGAAGWDYLPAR